MSAMKIAPSLTPKMKRPATMSSYGVPTAVSAAPSTPIAADPERDARGSVTVDQQSVDERERHIGNADHSVQHAELRLAESALPMQ